MIYRKVYPMAPAGLEPRSRVMIVDDHGDSHGEIYARWAAVADAAANQMIADLYLRSAKQEHVRMHTDGDEVVEIGAGSGEGE
jgi:hypothetical protein